MAQYHYPGALPEIEVYADYSGADNVDQWEDILPIASFPFTPPGFSDLVGNIWERTQDQHMDSNDNFVFQFLRSIDTLGKYVVKSENSDSDTPEVNCISQSWNCRYRIPRGFR